MLHIENARLLCTVSTRTCDPLEARRTMFWICSSGSAASAAFTSSGSPGSMPNFFRISCCFFFARAKNCFEINVPTCKRWRAELLHFSALIQRTLGLFERLQFSQRVTDPRQFTSNWAFLPVITVTRLSPRDMLKLP